MKNLDLALLDKLSKQLIYKRIKFEAGIYLIYKRIKFEAGIYLSIRASSDKDWQYFPGNSSGSKKKNGHNRQNDTDSKKNTSDYVNWGNQVSIIVR